MQSEIRVYRTRVTTMDSVQCQEQASTAHVPWDGRAKDVKVGMTM